MSHDDAEVVSDAAQLVDLDDDRLRRLTPLAIALTMRDEFSIIGRLLEDLETRMFELTVRVVELEETLCAVRAAISTRLVDPPVRPPPP